jgi:galactonate dehydratase
MLIPTAPGLGVDINEDAFAAHPYVKRQTRMFGGQVNKARPDDAIPYYTQLAV